MKKLAVALVAVAIIALAVTPHSGGQQQFTQKHQVVILRSFVSYQVYSSDGHNYQYAGDHVYTSSSSDGAPQFLQLAYSPQTNNITQLISLADAEAQLLSQGFEVKNVQPDNNAQGGLIVTLVK